MADSDQHEHDDTTLVVVATLPEFEKLCSLLHTCIIVFAVISGAALLVSSCTNYGLDDTDNRETGTRSNFKLYTDHGTGCQYLKSGDNLIPRVDGSGKHQGCKL